MRNITIGQRIRAIRIGQGLNIAQFGDLLGGVHKSIICKWEHGDNLPNNPRLKAIAEIGGISVEKLLYGEPVPEQLDTFIYALIQEGGRENLPARLDAWGIDPEQFQAIRTWFKKNADIEV
jgi:transcriptional regulator with XRE-family HTH domain